MPILNMGARATGAIPPLKELKGLTFKGQRCAPGLGMPCCPSLQKIALFSPLLSPEPGAD
jgi:hypothetical protein